MKATYVRTNAPLEDNNSRITNCHFILDTDINEALFTEIPGQDGMVVRLDHLFIVSDKFITPEIEEEINRIAHTYNKTEYAND